MSDSDTLCAQFTAHVGSYFGKMFEQRSFEPADCVCLRDGRECTALYRSPAASLLAELSDGAFHILLGLPDAPFPGGTYIDHAGQSGWYALFLLVEFKSGRQIYTEKVAQRFLDGELDPYRFEADLFERWADRILPMFGTSQEQRWRVDFSAGRRIFGHALPADLIAAVARNTHVPLLGEGWFVAVFVWGGAVAAFMFVFFGSVFFSGMPHSDPTAVRVVLVASLLVGLISGLAGLVVYRRLRHSRTPGGTEADLHRAVALHRRLVAGLLLLLGLAGLWHAWLFSPTTRALGSLAFIMALALGFVALPSLLALASGQSRRFGRVARVPDRLLLLGIGLTGLLVAAPPVARAEPGAFFLLLSQVMGLIALPWVGSMLAAARIHSRAKS